MNTKKSSTLRFIWDFLPFFVLSAFLFVCVFLIGHFKSYTVSQLNSSDVTETDGAISSSAEPSSVEKIPYITDIRIIAEYENGIGVFDSSGELLETHALDITRLPRADRQTLKEGITFNSEGEMRDFLESLDS